MEKDLEEMIALINEIQNQLSSRIEPLRSIDVPGISHPDRILSNFDLLCKTLIAFYSSDRRAIYLPLFIYKELQAELIKIKGSFSQEELTQTSAQGILFALDSCYAVSLKYGLITFGFDLKDIQTLVTSAGGVYSKIKEIGKEAELKAAEFDSTLAETHSKAAGRYDVRAPV